MRAALCASIAMNLLLATSIVLARVDATRGPELQPGASPTARRGSAGIVTVAADAGGGIPAMDGTAGSSLVALAEPVSLSDYYANLRAAGLAHSATLLPLAGWIYRALAAAGPLHEEYWRSSYDAGSRQAAIAALGAALRAELETIYGTEAAERAEFRGLYRPLGPRYDFLTSVQQIALAEGPMPAPTGGSAPAGDGRRACGASRAAGASHATTGVTGSDIVDADLRFELALRMSPLAIPLRELGLDEPAFRSAFAALEEASTASSASQQLEARRRLQSLLGDRAAREVMRAFDPVYSKLTDVLGAAELHGAVVDDAYRLVAESRDAMLALLLGGPDRDVTARVTALRREERERLTALVGAATADDVLEAVNRRSSSRAAGDC